MTTKFDTNIARCNEWAIAFRCRNLAVEELKKRHTEGDAPVFIGLFLFAQWIERSTKVLLIYRLENEGRTGREINDEARSQGHAVLRPLWDAYKALCQTDYSQFQLVKLALEDDDVRGLLKLVEKTASAAELRYINGKAATGTADLPSMDESMRAVLKDAAERRLMSLANDDRCFETEQDIFIDEVTSLVTFVLAYPVRQGAYGEAAKQQLAATPVNVTLRSESLNYLTRGLKHHR